MPTNQGMPISAVTVNTLDIHTVEIRYCTWNVRTWFLQRVNWLHRNGNSLTSIRIAYLDLTRTTAHSWLLVGTLTLPYMVLILSHYQNQKPHDTRYAPWCLSKLSIILVSGSSSKRHGSAVSANLTDCWSSDCKYGSNVGLVTGTQCSKTITVFGYYIRH